MYQNEQMAKDLTDAINALYYYNVPKKEKKKRETIEMVRMLTYSMNHIMHQKGLKINIETILQYSYDNDFLEDVVAYTTKGLMKQPYQEEKVKKANEICRLAEKMFKMELDPYKSGVYLQLEVPCECGAYAMYDTSKRIDEKGKERPIYYCERCGRFCDVVKGTNLPKGRPCSNEVRKLRQSVYVLLDKYWGKDISIYTRKKKLADLMGIPSGEMHIANFNANQCREAIRIIPLYK